MDKGEIMPRKKYRLIEQTQGVDAEREYDTWEPARIIRAVWMWIDKNKGLATIAQQCQTNMDGAWNIIRKVATNYGDDPKAKRQSIKQRMEGHWMHVVLRDGPLNKRERDMVDLSISHEGTKNGANDPVYIAAYLCRHVDDVKDYLKGKKRFQPRLFDLK